MRRTETADRFFLKTVAGHRMTPDRKRNEDNRENEVITDINAEMKQYTEKWLEHLKRIR